MCLHDVIEKYAEIATEAVRDQLKIGSFIERHSTQILDDLQQSAEEVRDGNDEVFRKAFIDRALPTIDSVIHVGSSRDNYVHAKTWVKEKRPEFDSMPAEPGRRLTLLTFVYIVCLALDKHTEERTWERIGNVVVDLLPIPGFKSGPE